MSVVAVFGITVASAATAVGAYLYLRGDGKTTVAETPNDDPRDDGEGNESENGEYFQTKRFRTVEHDGEHLVVGEDEIEFSDEVDEPDNGIITDDKDNPSGKTDLTNVKGIGETRAESFREEGFGTPDDLYYATDENLCEVNGIGDLTVSQIRDDIGSVDEDGYE